MSKKERTLRGSPACHDERRYSDEEIRFQKNKKNMCSRVKMAGKLRGKCLVEKVANGQEYKTKPNSK